VRVLNRDDAGHANGLAAAPVITFGADEAEQADCFGLVDENGMRWLSVGVAEEELPQKRRKKGDAVELEISDEETDAGRCLEDTRPAQCESMPCRRWPCAVRLTCRWRNCCTACAIITVSRIGSST
jgi:hypothetical protein